MAAEALAARDRIGVQDFVLLEDFTSVDAFTDNLKKRFNEKLIYVSTDLACEWVLCVVVLKEAGGLLCLAAEMKICILVPAYAFRIPCTNTEVASSLRLRRSLIFVIKVAKPRF